MKKTLKIAIAFLLSFAVVMTFAAAENTTLIETNSVFKIHVTDHNLGDFSDAPASSDWKFQGLNCAVANGVMNGHNGAIRPDDSLTRAEMVAMVVRVLDAYDIKADISAFVDVASGAWYYDYISSGVAAKFINGSGNKMMPNDPITREQTFAMLARTFLFTPKTEDASSAFVDEAKLSSWAEYATNALIDAKVVLGDNTNTLRPLENVTRAEMAALLDRIVCYFMKSGVNYNGVTIEGSVIYNDPSVNLNGVTINGDLYIVDGVGDAAIDLTGVTVTGRVVIRGGDAKIPAGSNLQIVRPEDYNENPQPTPDDGKEDKPIYGGGGSLPSGGSSFKIIEGEENNGTWISYGPQETKLYADVNGSTITFDLSVLETNDDSWKDILLHELCIVANMDMDVSSDGFHLVDFDTNEEKALNALLDEMVSSTSRAITKMLGITDDNGDIVADFTLGNLSEMVENAYIAYENDVSPEKWLQELFDERDISCIAKNIASFEGTISNSTNTKTYTYTVKMIVPELSPSGGAGGGGGSAPVGP